MPEVRLIDANALKNAIDSSYTVFGQCVYAKGIVDRQPTIEPGKHGRWKKKNGEIFCTNCKKSKWSESFELMLRGFDFCPKCGAKMDATDTNVGGKGDEEMDLSPIDFLAAEYDRKHPQGIRFVDCMEGADDGACKKV